MQKQVTFPITQHGFLVNLLLLVDTTWTNAPGASPRNLVASWDLHLPNHSSLTAKSLTMFAIEMYMSLASLAVLKLVDSIAELAQPTQGFIQACHVPHRPTLHLRLRIRCPISGEVARRQQP